MASTGVTFTAGSTTYIDDLETLRVFSEDFATEVETARDGQTTLSDRLSSAVYYPSITQNISLGGFKVTNSGPATNPGDLTNLSTVQALVSGGGTPGNIDIQDIGKFWVMALFTGGF